MRGQNPGAAKKGEIWAEFGVRGVRERADAVGRERVRVGVGRVTVGGAQPFFGVGVAHFAINLCVGRSYSSRVGRWVLLVCHRDLKDDLATTSKEFYTHASTVPSAPAGDAGADKFKVSQLLIIKKLTRSDRLPPLDSFLS
jgi:hypothetical protein